MDVDDGFGKSKYSLSFQCIQGDSCCRIMQEKGLIPREYALTWLGVIDAICQMLFANICYLQISLGFKTEHGYICTFVNVRVYTYMLYMNACVCTYVRTQKNVYIYLGVKRAQILKEVGQNANNWLNCLKRIWVVLY